MKNKKKGSHQWLIEFTKKPENLDFFMEVLDTALKNINSDYEAKRYLNITLDKPVLSVAKQDLFYNWLKKDKKLGGQHKIPRLANDRKIIEELLLFNQSSI